MCVCALFSFLHARTLSCGVCVFQPFPQQVSSDTRRWCLTQPAQRARLKTASLPWETVWPESSTPTCPQPSTHSSQGQICACEKCGALEKHTHLCQFFSFCQLCKTLFAQQLIHKACRETTCPESELQSRKSQC